MLKSINRKQYLKSLKSSTKCLTIYELRDLSSDESKISSFTSSRTDEKEARVVSKPISYLPDHLPQLRKRIKQKPWWRYRYIININPLPEESPQWTETPQYPPIYDTSKEGIKKQIRLEWYDAIKRLPTAQQKQYEIAKHYSHLNYILEPVLKQYNTLSLQQFITRTHLIKGQLPSFYDQINVDSILDNNLKQSILNTIASHLFETKQRNPKLEFKTSFTSQLGFPNRQIRVNLAKEEDTIEDVIGIIRKTLIRNYEHLDKVQIDLSPHVCNSWFHKDFPIPFKSKKWFSGETYDQCFTYKGTHALHLRTDNPLPQVLSLDNEICRNSEIPEYKYSLIDQGFRMKRHNLSSLPGFWSDNSYGFDFPLLICHSRQDLKKREIRNERSFGDTQDVIDGMAVMSSFAWLNGIASNLGFTLYHELTYPLVTNVIITDGQFWSFYVYQLNTHCFHSDVDNNLLRNVCWSSGDLKLFDAYENGQLIGVNDHVLKLIIKTLIREPQPMDNINLRPYLSEENRNEDDIKELSYSLNRRFVNKRNNFVQTRQKVHLWEKIYKYHKDAMPTPNLRQRPKMNYKYPPFFTR